jgi:hypothetical protein
LATAAAAALVIGGVAMLGSAAPSGAAGSTATITGTVTAAVGGAPLSGICVTVFQSGTGPGSPAAGSATTTAGGSYSVTGLAQNMYAVEFSNGCGNSGDYATQWYNNATSEQNAMQVQGNQGFTTGNINAQMAAGGDVSGVVTADPDGSTVQGACVFASPVGSSNDWTTAVSASDGTWSLDGLAVGSYDVQFTDGAACFPQGGVNHGYAPQYWQDASTLAAATPVQIVSGTPAGPIDARLTIGGSISGTVTAAVGGQALGGICVSAAGATFGVFGTAPDGTYSIPDLATGTYTVGFSNGCGNSQTWVPQSVQAVVVAPGDTSGVDAQMVVGYPPVVTSVSPNSGPTSGGTPVTITGSGFTGATQVFFGTNPGQLQFTVVSDTEITLTSPMGNPGPVDIQVVTPEGTSSMSPADQFTYEGTVDLTPQVYTLTPSSGPTTGGTTVVISGNNLMNVGHVSFGMTAATSFTVQSNQQITAVSPPQGFGGQVTVQVSSPNGTSVMSSGSQFTYTLAPTFTSPSAVGFVSGAPNSFTVSDMGFPVPAITIGPDLPSWLVVTSGYGQMTLSGTPPVGTRHQYSLPLVASSSVGSATQTLVLTVGTPPAFTTPGTATLHVGKSGTVRIHASGSPTPNLSLVGSLPPGVTFTATSLGNLTLTGVPAEGSGGTYPLTVRAQSATGSAQQALVITVDQPPSFTSSPVATWTHGIVNTLMIQTSAAYPVATLATKGTFPSWMTFTDLGDGTATLSGNPPASAVRHTPYAVTVVATGGGATVSQKVLVTVG